MTKEQAIHLFGTRAALVRSIGISSQAVSQWPEVLPERLVDELIGCYARVRTELPSPVTPAG